MFIEGRKNQSILKKYQIVFCVPKKLPHKTNNYNMRSFRNRYNGTS